jgi:hypothetical protein
MFAADRSTVGKCGHDHGCEQGDRVTFGRAATRKET